MAIPDYETIMLPLLRIAVDGQMHRFRDAVELLSGQFGLTDQERAEMLPSGTAPLFDNRVGWARTYLKQAGLVESPRRGVFRITDRGRRLLTENPESINAALLERYEEFRAFKTRRKEKRDPPEKPALGRISEPAETPEDEMASAYQSLRRNIEAELLDFVRSASPAFFERLVVDLLVKMGYGGSRTDAGRAIGRSGDEGIDGIISEDKLGLDVIYIQAKRWQAETTVGRPEIQKFAGALQGQRARKGVFITTSQFSRDAEEYVRSIEIRIILIDGPHLAALMVDHDVGVSRTGLYEVKRIDADYFDGE